MIKDRFRASYFVSAWRNTFTIDPDDLEDDMSDDELMAELSEMEN